MDKKNYISIEKICAYYHIPETFFDEIKEYDLFESQFFDKHKKKINLDYLSELEKIMRLRYELQVNMEGIDVILNLLQKIDLLQDELRKLKQELKLYLSDEKEK